MIDTDKYEEHLRTTMDYMNGFHNGDWNEEFKSCPHCDEKEWPDSSCSCGYGRIPDILMHVQWSHDELFGPLHETASDLLTEVKRLQNIILKFDDAIYHGNFDISQLLGIWHNLLRQLTKEEEE
jgi:hypothetical protein